MVHATISMRRQTDVVFIKRDLRGAGDFIVKGVRTMAKRRVKKVAKKDEVVPKILIGVPILAWTHEFAESFLKFWTDLMTFNRKGRRFHVGYKFMYRLPVHKAEETLAQLAMDSGCTHLLLMDDDIYDVTAEDLMKLLDADKEVVGGIMYASGFPHALCAFRRYDTKTKVSDQPLLKGPARLYTIPKEQQVGIQKVDLIPFCFTLIKTSLFKKLKKPWFNPDNQAPTDSWFADTVLGVDGEYYAHFGVWLNHRGCSRETQPAMMQLGMIKAQKRTGSVIRLTPEEMKRHEAMMRIKLADAETILKKAEVEKLSFLEKSKAKVAKPLGKQ